MSGKGRGCDTAVVFDGGATRPESSTPQKIPDGTLQGSGEVCCWSDLRYMAADRQIVSGVWICDPCDWARMEMGARCEFFHVLEGAITLQEDGCDPVEVSAGMSVVSPAGWTGRWRVTRRLRKVFMSFHCDAPCPNGGG